MIVFMAIFFFGYLFFLTSNYFMPNSAKYYSQMHSNQVLYNRTFTLLSWIYSEAEGEMEIMFTINNLSYDGINEYNVFARDRIKGEIQSHIIVQDTDLMVVRIDEVPKSFTDILLSISLDQLDDEIRFYTNNQMVQRVEQMPALSLNAYRIRRIELNNAYYQEEIDSYELEISETKSKLENAQKTLNDLMESVTYKTDNEIAEIQNNMSKVRSDIMSLQNSIQELELLIDEKEQQIENGNYQIHELEGGE